MLSRLFETVLILVVVSMAQPGWSQASALPTDVQNVLAAVGPTWGHDLRGNIETICARDGACPRFTRMEKHNHLSNVFAFNTAGEQLGREILEFMRRGR